ncbi:MAG: hypothetical protein V4520_18380 [Bacteroidota bacterium]
MKKLNNKFNMLTRAEAKKVLGGGVPVGGTGNCPEGTHIFTCLCGTDGIAFCVDNSMENPDCRAYIGWSVQDCVGIPGPQ